MGDRGRRRIGAEAAWNVLTLSRPWRHVEGAPHPRPVRFAPSGLLVVKSRYGRHQFHHLSD